MAQRSEHVIIGDGSNLLTLAVPLYINVVS
jgi:hypothetical protein